MKSYTKKEQTSTRTQQSTGGSNTQNFSDNRPEATAQMKLQQNLYNSPRVAQLSAQQDIMTSPSTDDIIQRHLFVDSPEDFTKLDDLGMWWGMACEWANKKSELGDKVSKNPHDYITSLLKVSSAKEKLGEGEQLRMLAHGDEDGSTISVGGSDVKASDKLQEIRDTYKAKHGKEPEKDKISPVHCFMGEKGGTLESESMDSGGIGSGPILATVPRMKSLEFDSSSGLTIDSEKWKGGTFIDKDGYWKTATDAASDLPKLTIYKKSADDKSKLAAGLEEVFAKLNDEYNKFAAACTGTGSADTPWAGLK